jgi:hypothetical protein
MEPYNYDPIPTENTIRILTLHAGEPSDPLRGELKFADLALKSPYEAISYCWGDSIERDDMLINEKSLPLTKSLSLALRRFRNNNEPREIWVDQACINQKDVAERSAQVMFMNQIYKNATCVLVWLGEDTRGLANMGFQLIETLNDTLSQLDKDENLTDIHHQVVEMFPREVWQPLGHLFHLPWVFSSACLHTEAMY